MFLSRPWGCCCALLVSLGLAGSAQALSRSTKPPAPQVTLNFPDAEIEAATRAMASMLGRAIVLDPRVKGRVTLYTEQPVSQAQAYALYQASLRGLGYAVVESGGLLKVVPETEAKLLATAVTPAIGSALTAGAVDQVVTRVFPIVHDSASNLLAVLRPLISANNVITVSPGTNALVITDYASNLARLATLIAALDTASATDVEVIRLQHSVASTLVVSVQRLIDMTVSTASATATAGASAPGAGGRPAVVMADTHLNALLVRAAHPAQLAAVRALVARLDQAGTARQVHVVYLKNAEATRLATVLRAAFPAPTVGAGGTATVAVASSLPAGGASSMASASGMSASSSSSQASTPVTATAAPSTGGYIQADPATNALIITAPEPLYRELLSVIEELDSRRAQLYVESLVVEVDASRALDVGVKWQEIFNISSSTVSTLTLGTVAKALAQQSGTNILSTANLVTLDNEEAKIVVGQNVPFVTGTYTTTSGSTSNPFQTIDRKDVGITLRLRPQIGENGVIRLTIFQESSSVASTSTSGPTTNKRSIETSVVVADGKIVVLGGLIEDGFSADNAEVPVLSGVPLIGNLFRSRSRTRKKTNLVVFLRPFVMRDDTATTALSLDRYDYIRARQRELPEDPRRVLENEPMPVGR